MLATLAEIGRKLQQAFLPYAEAFRRLAAWARWPPRTDCLPGVSRQDPQQQETETCGAT